MTPVNLMDTLAEQLEGLLSGYTTEQPSGTFPIAVFPGQVPVSDDASENRSAVYIIVRSVEDVGPNELSTATVKIAISIYDEDRETGWRSLYNVAEHIRQHLLKHRMLDKKFMLKCNSENPLKTDFEEDQPYPQWVAEITGHYTINQPEEEGITYD